MGRPKIHGEAGKGTNQNREYVIWSNIRYRCNNPKSHLYKKYGARGIKMCERWKDYRKFIADMGRRPSKNYSIDRIDNNLGYGPENCRWATSKQQAKNRRTTLSIEYNGRKQSIAEWARELGLPFNTLRNRIIRKRWPIDKIFASTKRPGQRS